MTGSHETFLAVAASALGVALLLREKFFSAATVIGVASLCRGEALICILALLTFRSPDLSLRKRLSACALALVPYLVWAAYAVKQFGTPFSSTIASKSAQGKYYDITLFLDGTFDYFNRFFHTYGFNRLMLIVSAGLILVIVLTIISRRIRYGEIIAILLCAAICSLYVALGLPFYFWFTTQLAIFTAIVIAFPWKPRSDAGSSDILLQLSRVISALCACALILTGIRMASSQEKFRIPSIIVMPDLKTNAYRQMGEWLNAHTQPNDLISTVEFGKIHYYSMRDLIDPLGILAPGLSPQVRVGNAIWEVEKYHPNVIVDVDDFQYFIAYTEYNWFLKAYRLSDTLNLESYPAEASRTHFRVYRLISPEYIPSASSVQPLTCHSNRDCSRSCYT